MGVAGWHVVHIGHRRLGRLEARGVVVVVMRNSTGVHRLWSINTCVRVSLRCSARWGFATSLLPRTKSLPVGGSKVVAVGHLL